MHIVLESLSLHPPSDPAQHSADLRIMRRDLKSESGYFLPDEEIVEMRLECIGGCRTRDRLVLV